MPTAIPRSGRRARTQRLAFRLTLPHAQRCFAGNLCGNLTTLRGIACERRLDTASLDHRCSRSRCRRNVHLHVDHTPPEIPKPSWEGETFGEGPNTISFSANDGSAQAPQSGVESILVFVDGAPLTDSNITKCPKPEGANVIPTEACFGLSGSWTLNGEDFAAGPHTITLARDWANNVSERTFKINIAHSENETQAVGPGTLNLISGDYKLGATDASVQAGNATLSVSRSYDSQSSASGPLGPGWTLSTPDTTAAGQWQSLTPDTEGVEVQTTDGRNVKFKETGEGFIAEQGFTTYTLTETSTSPVEYRITDSGGDYTQFAEPSGASTFMPTAVGQAASSGGINQVTYVLKEGKTSEIVGPGPAPKSQLHRNVRQGLPRARASLCLEQTGHAAKGEAPSEWGEIAGQLASVSFVEGAASSSEYTTSPVADYAYDKNGYLRAEWDPRVESTSDCGKSTCPVLKTTYGYGEGRLTALTAPGNSHGCSPTARRWAMALPSGYWTPDRPNRELAQPKRKSPNGSQKRSSARRTQKCRSSAATRPSAARSARAPARGRTVRSPMAISGNTAPRLAPARRSPERSTPPTPSSRATTVTRSVFGSRRPMAEGLRAPRAPNPRTSAAPAKALRLRLGALALDTVSSPILMASLSTTRATCGCGSDQPPHGGAERIRQIHRADRYKRRRQWRVYLLPIRTLLRMGRYDRRCGTCVGHECAVERGGRVLSQREIA